MSLTDLLARLAAAGLSLRRDGDRLLAGPTALLAAHPALVGEVRAHKAALLLWLAAPTDEQIDAIAERAWADDPFEQAERITGDGAVCLRESALLFIDGCWIAISPATVAWSAAWNRMAAERWAKGGAAKAMVRPRAKKE